MQEQTETTDIPSSITADEAGKVSNERRQYTNSNNDIVTHHATQRFHLYIIYNYFAQHPKHVNFIYIHVNQNVQGAQKTIT